MRLGLAINQMSQISGFLDQERGLESLQEEGLAATKKGMHHGWLC